jgi:hypothetical protein
MNIVKERDRNPIYHGKFHWPALDTERSDDNFLTKAKLVTCKTVYVLCKTVF